MEDGTAAGFWVFEEYDDALTRSPADTTRQEPERIWPMSTVCQQTRFTCRWR